MSDATTYDLIERYLAGTMSAEERTSFEARMTADPAMQAEVNLHRDIAEVLKGESIHDFKNILHEVDENFVLPDAQRKTPVVTEAKIRTFSFRRLLSIAAAVIVLVVAVFVLLPNPSVSSNELFAQHYAPYEMILNQRSADEGIPQEQIIKAAVMAYESKEYDQAATLFRGLMEQDPASETYQLYYAISLLSGGDATTAIETLKGLYSNASPLFVEQSRWYLAMAYLKAERLDKAKGTLRNIAPNTYQYDAAQTILKRLE